MDGIHQRPCVSVFHREMRGALYPVQLVQVVGQNAGRQQFLAQSDQGIRIIVDLVQQRASAMMLRQALPKQTNSIPLFTT